MAENCAVCGKKIGGMLGWSEAGNDTKLLLDKLNIHMGEGKICEVCAREKIRCVEKNTKQFIQNEKAEANESLHSAQSYLSSLPVPFDKIQTFTSRHPESWKAEIKGMVSGHSVVGTGPLTAIASAWTDFFGKESIAYLEKIRIGEKNAILAAKMQAFEIGATDICDATLSISEATSGNGMLMVSFVGTAIAVQGHECEEGKAYMEAQGKVRAAQTRLEEVRGVSAPAIV